MGGSATNVTNEECEEGQLGSWAVGKMQGAGMGRRREVVSHSFLFVWIREFRGGLFQYAASENVLK